MFTYQLATDYLREGRKKYVRPLYDRSLYIWKEDRWSSTSNICIGWQSWQPMIILHSDGTTTIQAEVSTSWGGTANLTHSNSAKLTFARYAGIHSMYVRNHKAYVVDRDFTRSPSKIKTCRICSGSGRVDDYCYPSRCNETMKGNKCEVHGEINEKDIMSYGSYGWHYEACEHGKTNGHTVYKARTCFQCNGTKKFDYGNKPIALQWDGSPLRLRDGNVIKKAATLLERMVANYVEPISEV